MNMRINMKIVPLFLLTLVILAGSPASLATPLYNTSLNAVYGNGSCGTCHVNASNDGPRTSYGTLFENQPNHAANASAALIAIRAPPTANPTRTVTPTVTMTAAATATLTATPLSTPEETKEIPDEVETQTPEEIETPAETAAPAVTTVKAAVTPTTPGFGFVAAMVGLFAWSLLVKRKNN